jgi:hypothetical protein
VDAGTVGSVVLLESVRDPTRQGAERGQGLSPWLVLGALIVVSIGLRTWAALAVPVPWIAPDEMIYGVTGQNLYRSGSLDILGGPTPFFSLLVPVVAGLPLGLSDLALGYDLLKPLQALVMSLTAVPVYLWGCSLVRPRWALVAAALTLALPGLVYSGLVMSEVLFYPMLVLAAWAAARAIERPTLARQAMLVGAVALAVLTRLQAIVLLPAIVTAIGLDAALARSLGSLRRFAPTFAVVAAAVIAWAAWRGAAGGAGLGGYEVVAHDSYHVATAARYVLYHAGAVTILTGVFPLCALLLLLVGAVSRGEPDPARRAFLAVAGALTAWFVLEVGIFASRYVGQLAERDLIALAPVLFLALSLWIDRGAPRTYWRMTLVGLAVACSLAFLPLGRLVTSYAPPDAPTLVSLYDLRQATSKVGLEIAFFVVAGAAIIFLAIVPRRLIVVLPLILGVGLIGASVAASRYAAREAGLSQTTSLGADPRWIDHAARGPVAYLSEQRSSWISVWENVFWNRRIGKVYGLNGARVFGPIPQVPVTLQPDGTLAGVGNSPPRYVVAAMGNLPDAPAYAFYGSLVTSVERPDSQAGRLALWKVDAPLRLSSRVTGLAPNGDVHAGGTARLVAYGCPGRVFDVTLIIKQPQTVTVLRNGFGYRRLVFRSPTVWQATIPTAPPAVASRLSACTLEIRPSRLIGTTVLRTLAAPAPSS